MRSCVFFFSLLALGVCLLTGGCDRNDKGAFTAEVDEPGYHRGKDLLRQGRNQEAIAEFQKVIDKRGLNNSPESSLELAVLYHQHIHDPLGAIYFYRKYRELKPNSPQADLVLQQIDAATREFARTLPAQPLENRVDRLDMTEVVQRLQRENEQLKADLQAARNLNALNARQPAVTGPANGAPAGAENAPPQRPAYSTNPDASPLIRGTGDAEPSTPQPAPANRTAPVTNAAPPARPPTVPTAPANASRTPAPTTGAYRRHTVVKSDNLYSLSQKYYGTKSRWNDIYNANRDVMKSPTDLKIGVELKIPQ
jgi:tetratricopeptide (TPR) repeat protein